MKKNTTPARAWLSFVKSGKARSKIKTFLNIKTDTITPDEDASPGTTRLKEKIVIAGMKTVKPSQIKFSKCCMPQFKTPILAFLTKDKKITIHAKTCPNTASLNQSKSVLVMWKEEEAANIQKMKVVVHDRVGLLAEVLNLIARLGVNVLSVNTRSKKENVVITFKMEVPGSSVFDQLVALIRNVDSVIDVKKFTQEGKEVATRR